MVNTFKHTGHITLQIENEAGEAEKLLLPYAFGPNQARLLDQLRGWEFWQHQELVMPALYAAVRFSHLRNDPEADLQQLAEAREEMRRSLFADPSFVQEFYWSALKFGAELAGEPFDLTPAEVGMYEQQAPSAFMPALAHYVQIQAERVNVDNARPTSAPKPREAVKPTAKKKNPSRGQAK